METDGPGGDLLEAPRTSEGDDDEFDGHAHYTHRQGLVGATIHGRHVVALIWLGRR